MTKRWRCDTPTFFADRMWKEGEVYQGLKANEHFTDLDEEYDEDDLEELPIDSRLEIIKSALKNLDYDNEDHWTKGDGLPMVKVVEEMSGLDTSRVEIEKAWPGFNRDTIPMSKNVNRSSSFNQAMKKI